MKKTVLCNTLNNMETLYHFPSGTRCTCTTTCRDAVSYAEYWRRCNASTAHTTQPTYTSDWFEQDALDLACAESLKSQPAYDATSYTGNMSEHDAFELACAESLAVPSRRPTMESDAVSDDMPMEEILALTAMVAAVSQEEMDNLRIADAENLTPEQQKIVNRVEYIIDDIYNNPRGVNYGETSAEHTVDIRLDGETVTLGNACAIVSVFRAVRQAEHHIDVEGYCLALLYLLCVAEGAVRPGKMTGAPAFIFLADLLQVTIVVDESASGRDTVPKQYGRFDRHIFIKNTGNHYVPA